MKTRLSARNRAAQLLTVLAVTFAYTANANAGELGGAKASPKTRSAELSVERRAPATAGSRVPLSKQQIAEQLMDSTCHIVFVRNGKVIQFGTGWVYDAEERLVVTNHHVIDNGGPPTKLRLYFPVKENGEWVVEDAYYYKNVRASVARIIGSSKQHDLALLQADKFPANVKPLPLAKKSAPRGSQLHSVGGKPIGSDSMWPYTNGHVRQIGDGRNALGYKTRILQAQMETNKGNSGGPIVNDFAEVVGVCEGHRLTQGTDRVRNVSLYVDLQALRTYLKETRPLANPVSAADYFRRGKGHFDMKRYDSALRDLSASIRKDATRAKAFTLRAQVLLNKGDYQTAIADCDRAIKLDESPADAYFIRGNLYRKLKSYDKAVRDLTSAISIDPTVAKYYHQRGVTQHFAGKSKNGYADFTRSTELAPKSDFFWSERGFIARVLGRYDDSLGSYLRAVKLNTANPSHHNGVGRALMRLGKPDKAAIAFATAVVRYEKRYRKSNPTYYYNLGVALKGSKDFKRAHAAFSAAIKHHSKYADAYHQRSLVLRELGNHDAAEQDAKTAMRLAPKTYGKTARVINKRKRSQAPEYVGKWVYRKTVNGGVVRIDAILTADGRYATRTAATAYNGVSESENDTGTYQVSGNYLTSTSTDGELTRYYIEMKGGRLWLYDYSSKTWLDFARLN